MSHKLIAAAVIDGWQAREEGKPETACPYREEEGRYKYAWLAGWNDRDIELTGNRYFPDNR